MTPDEIARRLVDDWWKGLGALAGKTQITSERAITLAAAIASAIRAKRERAEALDAALLKLAEEMDAENLSVRLRCLDAEAERDRLREERNSLMTRVNHGTPKDACYSTDDDPNCPLEHLWITRNGDLRAERDKLREALDDLIHDAEGLQECIEQSDMQHDTNWLRDTRDTINAAREALARTKGESDE